MFAGVLAAAAGFLWSTGIGLADSGVFGPVRSLSIVAAVVIGGLGSVAGAIVGAVYFLGIPYWGAQISPYIGLLATGVGLLLLVTMLPGGLARAMYGGRDLLARCDHRHRPPPEGRPASPMTRCARLRMRWREPPTGDAPKVRRPAEGDGDEGADRQLRGYLGGEALFPIVVLFLLNAVDEFDTATFDLLGPEIADHFDVERRRRSGRSP